MYVMYVLDILHERENRHYYQKDEVYRSTTRKGKELIHFIANSPWFRFLFNVQQTTCYRPIALLGPTVTSLHHFEFT